MGRILIVVLLLLAWTVTSITAKDRNFLTKQLLEEVLNDGYCQGMNMARLTDKECKQNKWEELVRLIVILISNCLTSGSGEDAEYLAALSVNASSWVTLENLQKVILYYAKTCLEAEVIGSSPKSSTPEIDPCTSSETHNLTEWWRQDDEGSNIRPVDNYYNCDKDLQGNKIWFRIKGAAGDHLADSCAPQLSCGSHGGFWSDAAMPSKVGETWQVHAYGSLNDDCDWYTWPVSKPLTVKRCSSREFDFVYKLHGTSECYWSICGTE